VKGIERLIYVITLAPTKGGGNYHTARQNYIKYDKKHASLPKNTYNIKSTQKTKARFSRLLRHPAWKRSA